MTNPQKKRRIYQARARRIAFTLAVAIAIAALLGLVLYLTFKQVQAGAWWLVSAGLTVSVVMLSVFGLALREAEHAIQRRGYARPISTTGGFNRLVKSILPPPEPDVAHPAHYQRSLKRVLFDDASHYDVDLGLLYIILLRETQYSNVLPWQRSVIEEGMDKKAWAAYRKLLLDAGVVDEDGRGALHLNCTPWPAIEAIKARL